MNGEKPFYLSWTFWFNGLTILTTIAVYFGYTPNEELALEVKNLLLAVGPIINLILRLKTRKPLGLGAFKRS